MSNVTLSIGGRSYTVACAEGEERHVLGLGAAIDRKLATMGDMSGQAETRMLLFASLLLADELHEANGGGPQAGAPQAAVSPEMVEKLDALANRLENLAARLES
jgi:cell division protein ZapA